MLPQAQEHMQGLLLHLTLCMTKDIVHSIQILWLIMYEKSKWLMAAETTLQNICGFSIEFWCPSDDFSHMEKECC